MFDSRGSIIDVRRVLWTGGTVVLEKNELLNICQQWCVFVFTFRSSLKKQKHFQTSSITISMYFIIIKGVCLACTLNNVTNVNDGKLRIH